MATAYEGSLNAAAGLNGTGTYQLATSAATADSTSAAYANSLRFAASKSIRTSTIILATFNTIVAFATAMGIIYDCYILKRRRDRRTQAQPPSGLFFITTVQSFPLIISLGISIQGIIFAVSQSVGLQGLLARGCTLTAIFMLPGIFITPYIELVFGVELALRALRSKPFAPRGLWNVRICLAIVCCFLLATFLVADFIRAPDFCFASLFWFVKIYAPGCFGLFLGISIILIGVIGIVFVRLGRGSTDVSETERAAATRMIYYLALGLLYNAFIIPFFFSLTFLDQKTQITETLNLSMVAAVVANVSGLLVAGLHLFLRSQARPAVGSGDTYGDYERQTKRDRSDSNADGGDHQMRPFGHNLSRSASNESLFHDDGAGNGLRSPDYLNSPTPNPLRANAFLPSVTIPQAPDATVLPSETSPSHMRKQSYSLFPHDASSTQPISLLPATTYSPMAMKPFRDTFRPPPSVRTWLGRGHRRDSSVVSSATVQIGLRLSNVADVGPPRKKAEDKGKEVAIRPSPLTQVETVESDLRSLQSSLSKYSESESVGEEASRRRSLQDAILKMLPPVPTKTDSTTETQEPEPEPESEPEPEEQGQLITLSPLVYSPQDSPAKAKLPSPMGVGFSIPGRVPSQRSAKHPPPRPRNNSNADSDTLPTDVKSEWI